MPADQPSANEASIAATEAERKPASRRQPLSPAAQRALAEAAARRAARDAASVNGRQEPERHGRGGLEPTRYGDWEINGLASDF